MSLTRAVANSVYSDSFCRPAKFPCVVAEAEPIDHVQTQKLGKRYEK